MKYGNENWRFKKKLSVIFLVAITVVFFTATAFGAGNTYLTNNLRVFPNLLADGKTQPVIPMHVNDWVNEEVWVEAPLDSDEDGKRDLCCFHYSIPKSSKVSTNIETIPLLVVPMLITATPYTGNSVPSSITNALSYQYLEPKVDGPWPGENNPSTLHYTYEDVEDVRKLYKDIAAADFKPDWLPSERSTWIIERDGTSRGTTTPPNSPGFSNYFRSRGYGYGCHYIIGTARAEGLLHMKDYNEYISAAAVVDWLNGRVKAYRYPYPVRLATDVELNGDSTAVPPIAPNPRLNATTPNLNQNIDGTYILDNKYIRDDINGGYVEVKAHWATGYAMMAGQSYEGCMSVQAMVTGVEGLKVVVPFAPTIGIYDYYRANGTVRAPGGYQGEDIPEWMVHSYGRLFNPSSSPAVTHPTTMGNNNPEIWDKYYRILDDILTSPDRYTGSYNKWWDARHAAKHVKEAKGAIIAFHGFNDWNVTFKNTALLYEACKKEGVAIKGVFHLMKHASPWTQEGFDFIPRIHTVLDNMLYGIANEGLDAFPNVIIHNNDTLEYEEHENWPINDRYQKFYPTGSDRVGSLSINKPKQIELLDFVEEKALTLVRPVVTATSNPQMAAAQYTTWKHNLIGGSDTALSTDAPFNILPNQDRLVYTVDISEDTRISGYIKMTAKIASDKKVGGISAMLVDYGAANYVHRTFASAGTVGSTTNVNSVQNWPAGSSASGTWGANTTNLTVLNKNTAIDPWNIISRGHVSVQKPNYNGNIWVDAPNTNYIPEFYYQTTVIEPGKFYPYTWELNVMDYTIKAGHKLGLILYSTDPEHIQRPLTNPTTFTVEIGQDTYLSLPIVGEFVTSEVPDVLVTGVTLAPGAVSLNVGSTRQLTQTVAPANATDQSVTWSSTNTAAATVSNTGEVAALAAGTATITVTTNDGGFVASCDVTVTTTVSVDSVTVAPKTASITVGGTQQLTETVLPSTATIKTVTWSSSNSAVATVSNAGLVTAVSAGTATITVTAVDDATKSDTCAVTVTSVPVTGVSVTPTSVTVVKGDTRALSAAVAPSNATNQVVTWSSGNAAVATVSNTGVVTAVAAGTATITVRTNDGGFEDTCVITVPPSIAPVDPTYPSDLNAVADDTGIAASDLETKDGKVYLKKGLAEVIAKALLNAGSVNTTVQPVFEGTVAPDGQIAQLTFTMTGKDLLASFADEINLIGLVSGISGKRFSYTDNAADYDDGKFTLLSGGAIFSGEIDPNATYQLVAFIQDGGEFDLDGATNGEFIASVFIASEKTGGGGGGCSTFGYLAFAILALPFLLKRKS